MPSDGYPVFKVLALKVQPVGVLRQLCELVGKWRHFLESGEAQMGQVICLEAHSWEVELLNPCAASQVAGLSHCTKAETMASLRK